jgi:hypothetical protein
VALGLKIPQIFAPAAEYTFKRRVYALEGNILQLRDEVILRFLPVPGLTALSVAQWCWADF